EDSRRRALGLSEPVRRGPARVGVRSVVGDLEYADAVDPLTNLENGQWQRVATPTRVDAAREERGAARRARLGQGLDRPRMRPGRVDEVHHRTRDDVGARAQDCGYLGDGLPRARL